MYVLRTDSDSSREKWLDRMLKTATLTVGFGAGLLPRELVDRGTPLIDSFTTAVEAKSKALSTRRKQVEECDRGLSNLEDLCRSFRRVVIARAVILGQSKEIFKIFGMSVNGAVPKIRYKRDWLEVARNLIKAEAVAVERGYPPMSTPEITTVATALAAAEAACQGVDEANLAHQEALTTLKLQRAEVEDLKATVLAYFRFALRPLSASRRREIMRRYGYIFSGDVTENEDETPGRGTPPGQTDDEPATGEQPRGENNETGNTTTTPQP
ncbi:MAG: hypothetical protein QNK37_25035 [Acidobacteriota bacterium]|nr:hypothetical protein [Acidobacteriota bacterium]